MVFCCNHQSFPFIVVFLLVICANFCSCLPRNRRSTEDDNSIPCATAYQQEGPALQLHDGIKVAEHFTKFGILDHGEAPSNFMTFYTSLASLSQVAIRLEDAVSMWSTMSVSSTATNNTSDSNCTASNNCATTGNNSNATNTDSSVPTDDNSNSSTTGYNSIGNSSSYAYEWLEIQALSAVVGQVVADACNYALEIAEEHHEVNCYDFDEVANFSLSQYESMRTRALAEHRPNVFTVSEAYSVLLLMPSLKPIGETSDGSIAWVQALIPRNLHAPICADATHLHCNCS